MSRAAWINGLAISSVFWALVAFATFAHAEEPFAALLARVNTTVNLAHVYDEPDTADIGDGVYDCENYAYDKRALLLAAGVSAGEMRVERVILRNGESHAVLAVYPVEGPPRVLDSIVTNVASKRDLIDFRGYRWTDGAVVDPYTGKTDWARAFWLAKNAER